MTACCMHGPQDHAQISRFGIDKRGGACMHMMDTQAGRLADWHAALDSSFMLLGAAGLTTRKTTQGRPQRYPVEVGEECRRQYH